MMRMSTLAAAICGLAALLAMATAAEEAKAPAPARPKARAAVKSDDLTAESVGAAAKMTADFLLKAQNKDGSFGEMGPSVGMTGLAVLALAEGGANADEAVRAAVDRGVKWLLSFRQNDGGIYIKTMPFNSYETSIAIMTLSAVDAAAHREVIDGAVKFLRGIQDDGTKNPLNKGGIGYGSKDEQANLSTTHYALQALKAAGVKEDDEVWKRAVGFVAICQNSAETNSLEYAAVVNDGGFIYSPVESKAGKVAIRGKEGWRSYGSMTYAGYLSYVYARLSPDDERVKGAERWIAANYTLDENPGMKMQGLYYYYHTFALAFAARGQKTLKLADGREVGWAQDLGAKLLSLQDDDGGFTNPADRWHEGSRVICASYALRALNRVKAGL
jgi:squalene-hopene/tetraprenyl-beta-curcumene cyclase